MKTLLKPFKEWRIVSTLIDLSKNINFPGSRELPVFDVGKYFFKSIEKGDIASRASSLSFNFFLALFPAIIFLFTLIAYVPISNFQEQLLILIKNILPQNAYEATRATIEDIIKRQRGGLLSFGFILALYFSTNGVHAMIEAFNKSYHIIETRSTFKQRLISLILTIILSFLLLLAITLIIMSELALKYLMNWGFLNDVFLYYLLLFGRWIIICILFFCIVFLLYYFAPAKSIKFKFILPGSLLATFLSLLSSLAFTYFVNNFGQYNKIYGSIGTLIVVLLWIYFNSLILLLGFEFNVSINKARSNLKISRPKNKFRSS